MAVNDRYRANEYYAVTPSNTADNEFDGFYVGVGGNVAIIGTSMQQKNRGLPVILQNMQPGVPYPFTVSKIMSTGTTASGIVGLKIVGK